MITAKPGNILLWDYSLKNPENILDEYYFHDVSHLVIPATKSESDLASEYFVVEIEINKVIQEISTSTTESEQKIKLEKKHGKINEPLDERRSKPFHFSELLASN